MSTDQEQTDDELLQMVRRTRFHLPISRHPVTSRPPDLGTNIRHLSPPQAIAMSIAVLKQPLPQLLQAKTERWWQRK